MDRLYLLKNRSAFPSALGRVRRDASDPSLEAPRLLPAVEPATAPCLSDLILKSLEAGVTVALLIMMALAGPSWRFEAQRTAALEASRRLDPVTTGSIGVALRATLEP